MIAGVDASLPLSPGQRVLLATQTLAFYTGRLLWPQNLAFVYERWPVNATDVSAYLYPALLALALAVTVWRTRRGSRGPLAALLIFAGTLLPVSGVTPIEWFVFSWVADHFVYVASAAFFVALASRPGVAIVGWLAVPVLGVASWSHGQHFRDNASLWGHAAQTSPASAVAHYQHALALALLPEHVADGRRAIERARDLNPASAEVLSLRGRLFLVPPTLACEAVIDFDLAFRLKPGLPGLKDALTESLILCADHLAERGDLDAAVARYKRALAFAPDSFAGHFNLGIALLRIPGMTDQAAVHFEACIRLQPLYASAYSNLGLAIARNPARLGEAAQHLRPHYESTPHLRSLAET